MWVKILLLFFCFSFLFRTDHSFDQDLGRHIKLGEIIWQTKAVPKTNLFSYTNPDFPFINTHWLFEVLAYFMSNSIGIQAFLVLKIIIFLLSVWLILKIIPKENRALLLPVGFFFLHILRERLELRPEIFSFLFTASTYYILEKYLKSPTKLIYLLPLIQLIWINTHIYFFVGLVLQAVFIIHLEYKYFFRHEAGKKLKLLLFIFTGSILLSLLNPNGLAGFLYPLNVTQNYGYTIAENQTIFLLESLNFADPNFLFVKIAIFLSLLTCVAALSTRKFEIKNLLVAIFGIGLSLLNVRSFPYLVFLSFPAVMLNFGPLKVTSFTKILTIIFGILLLSESFFYLNGSYYRFRDDINSVNFELQESGKNALDFLINKDLPSPIYNNFDIGSYIIYRGYPKYKVFVDGRPEAYPKDFFLNTYIPSQSDYAKFKELEKQYGFKTIIFSITDQTPWGKTFLAQVVKDPDWKTIYIDDFMIILTKNNIAEEKGLNPVELSKLSPSDYKFKNHRSYINLSIFLLNTNNPKPALDFAVVALQIFPESPIAGKIKESLTGPVYDKKTNIFW